MPRSSNPTTTSQALAGCPASPSPQGVEEFKALYAKNFGVELSGQEALEASTHLLHLLYFGLTPFPDEEQNRETRTDHP